jgi:hypothetical protein
LTLVIVSFLVAGCAVRGRCGILVHRELVSSLENVWVVSRTEDVSLLSLPLGLVDGINPVLNLHHHAAILLDNTRLVSLVEEALSLLNSGGSYCIVLVELDCCISDKTHRSVQDRCRSGRPAGR